MDLEDAAQSLSERMRAAAQARQPLRIRGLGSKDFYGQRLHGEVLSTAALRGILSYEPSELVLTAAAGTPLAEVEAALAAQGQYLPFEPPRLPWSGGTDASVGGMVASGLSGPARASVGCLRDYVLGVHLINGQGERLQFGGQVMKNVAGYDVSRLMVGALGTLGLITQVSLKVLPVPPADATLRFELPQAQALDCLQRWGGQPLPLNASRWQLEDGKGLLYLRLRGAQAAVRASCAQLLGEQPGVQLPSTEAAWDACRDQRLPFFQPPAADLALWRLSLPPATPALDLPEAQLVEWHGGLRWLWAPLAARERLQTLACQHGGHATLFVAENLDPMRLEARFSSQSPALWAIHRRLKAAFDPQGVCNPGRLYAEL